MSHVSRQVSLHCESNVKNDRQKLASEQINVPLFKLQRRRDQEVGRINTAIYVRTEQNHDGTICKYLQSLFLNSCSSLTMLQSF